MTYKTLLLSFFFLFLPHLIYAQYDIYLDNIDPSEVNYLDLGGSKRSTKQIRVTNKYLEISGKPVLPVMGEFHYQRMDSAYWEDALLKMRSTGINIVSTYVLWNIHEEFEGTQNWQGRNNLRSFVKLCQKVGLLVHLRIGPYCNAEIPHGGLPDWLVNNSSFKVRTNDKGYLKYVKYWYTSIFKQVRGLFYKDNGPIMAIQLENEYVKPGLVISHLMNLKKLAQNIGFDAPLYTMTHWMDSDYPKGELIPYAGYYIETPWISNGKDENPPSNFEYFTYDRISDNIGTDLIKVENDLLSLNSDLTNSPYFTCEVGVGTTAFYNRRAIIPKEMAGENINLRLGCGVNLMGYYMYVGGLNPINESFTVQSFGPIINYDYQAPIGAYGKMGAVMAETKKYNYFMNCFGHLLAPFDAYLPVSNMDKNNLQWAVRSNGTEGFLFCSKYLYKHERDTYKDVQFKLNLKDEVLKIPSDKMTISNKSYFFWPFNLNLNGIKLKYSTLQPICLQHRGNDLTLFCFSKNNIKSEIVIDQNGVANVLINGRKIKPTNGKYYLANFLSGRDTKIAIHKNDGAKVNIIPLTEEDSDLFWFNYEDESVYLSNTPIIFDNEEVYAEVDSFVPEIYQYFDSKFQKVQLSSTNKPSNVDFSLVRPFEQSLWMRPLHGKQLSFTLDSLPSSAIEKLMIRFNSKTQVTCYLNGQKVDSEHLDSYELITLFSSFDSQNCLRFEFNESVSPLLVEVEAMFKNGERQVYSSSPLWKDLKQSSASITAEVTPVINYDKREHLAVYKVDTSSLFSNDKESHLFVNFLGDIANAYCGKYLLDDFYFNGTPWLIGLNRFKSRLLKSPLIIRIDGLREDSSPIYFEKGIKTSDCFLPRIKNIICESTSRVRIK